MSTQKSYKVALVGNPNSGKSAIFNVLTGARQTLGNWPGVTVEKKEGEYTYNNKVISVVDLPGSYSLKAQSEDEMVACQYILSDEADLYVNVLDANNLERNLYLTMQLIELQKPMLFAINMIDIAQSHGIYINAQTLRTHLIQEVSAHIKKHLEKGEVNPDQLLKAGYDPDSLEETVAHHIIEEHKGDPALIAQHVAEHTARKATGFIDGDHLESHLGATVIAFSAVKKGAEAMLKKAIDEAVIHPAVPPLSFGYVDEVEEVISAWTPLLKQSSDVLHVPPRYIAIKLLENDKQTVKTVFDFGEVTIEQVDQAKFQIRSLLGSNPSTVIAEGRYAAVHGMIEDVVTTKKITEKNYTNRIDRVVLNRFAGIPIFLGVMFLMFWVVQRIGGAFIDFFDISGGALFVDLPKEAMNSWQWPSWFIAIIADGIGGGLQTVGTFVPIIFAMFFCLSVLEDSGYMSRAAFIMDRFMRMIGLPGKSFVPLIVGFGCTVPAIMGTRALENRRDRVMTIFMAPMMSCGARLPVLALFAAAFFGQRSSLMVFSIYLLGVVMAILTGLLMNKTFVKAKASNFIMELPPYHIPRLRHVLKHAWGRLKGFIFRAGKFIIVAMIVMGSLNSISVHGGLADNPEDSVLSTVGRAITPVFTPFGVEKENWPAGVALFTGLFAKEAIIGTLSALYSFNNSDDMTEEEPFSLKDSMLEALQTIPANLQDAFVGSELISSDSGEDEETEALLFTNMKAGFTRGPWQAYAYLIFVLLYVPCLAAMGTALKELGYFYGAVLVIYLTVTAWALATLFYQIMLGHSVLWISVAIFLMLLMVIMFAVVGRRGFKELDFSPTDKNNHKPTCNC